ncbi:hypothetical protein AB6Q13_09355 [Ralstonia solanacearum]|uniref:hypothetical protein n=1 Tax=Ralstonia solanacearum TaxID=305 RepID=UPI0023058CD4|nr:hypothetical protein [Ralstonia solanacearum]MDB0567593.1 hypothetical protein [Ralstonia solanacearum]MDB0577412.1 hypothetical protein [Ralstonia solanacearum]
MMIKANLAFCMNASALLIFLSGNVLGAEAETFAERHQLAKLAEEQEPTRSYLNDKMFPAVGAAAATAMRDCLTPAGAGTEPFTVLADLSKDGNFTRIAYAPKTDTAACFAAAMPSFHAPPPPTQDGRPLPISIDMKVIP